uniref:Reverse transcriptase domain-containing protein n=1 Tax=Phlebotomus papatasi TaxID=29031 RepID=A0A1B0DKS8_PHLPP
MTEFNVISAIKVIPEYDGSIDKLSNFIELVELIADDCQNATEKAKLVVVVEIHVVKIIIKEMVAGHEIHIPITLKTKIKIIGSREIQEEDLKILRCLLVADFVVEIVEISEDIEVTIEVKPNVAPVYVKPYRLPYSQKEEIHRQVDAMLKDDIIEETVSEWSSPLLLVPKKSDADGKKLWRVVIDYRSIDSCMATSRT